MSTSAADSEVAKSGLNMYQEPSQYFPHSYSSPSTSMQRHEYDPYYLQSQSYVNSNYSRNETSPPLSVTSQTPSTSSPSIASQTLPLSHRGLPTPPNLSPDASPSTSTAGPSSAASTNRSDFPPHHAPPYAGQIFPSTSHCFASNNMAGPLYPSSPAMNHSPGVYPFGTREGLPVTNLPTSVQHHELENQRSLTRPEYQWMKKEPQTSGKIVFSENVYH